MLLTPILKRIALCSILIISFNGLSQLPGWQHLEKLNISNPGTAKTNYQVLLELNTAAYVAAGEMLSTGNDIRFGSACNGASPYEYWIEAGMNTASTQIWVKVDNLPANGNKSIFLFHGNTAATAASDFNLTFPNQKIVTAAEVADVAVWNFDWVEIQAGASVLLSTVNRPAGLTINARKIIIAGSLSANGAGFAGGVAGDGNGPGAGLQATSTGGGGAGHAAVGGNGSHCCSRPDYAGAGGPAYGNATSQTALPGSGGGAPGLFGSGAPGGDGGGVIVLNATSIQITGTVETDGAAAPNAEYCGGGGSGGTLLIKGYNVNITSSGILRSRGGKGGSATAIYYGGGGGAGGRVKIFYDEQLTNNTTNIFVNGGIKGTGGNPEGQAGGNGTIHIGTYTSDFPEHTGAAVGGSISLTTTVNQHVSCFGGNDASAICAVTAGGSYNFAWDNGYTESSVSSSTISGLSAGTYSVTITDPADACAGPFLETVTITEPPIIDFGLNAIDANCGASDGIAFLDVAASGGTPGYSQEWSNMAIADSIYGLAAGSYDMTITDNNGCQITKSIVLGTTPVPAANVPTPATVCSADPFNLNETGGDAVSWQWSSDGSAAFSDATVQNPDISGAANNETFTVTITGANGCTNTENIQITVNQSPTAVAGNTGPICTGNPVNLNETGSTSGVSWLWSSNMGATISNPTGQNANATNVTNGEVFTVVVTDLNSNCTASSTTAAVVVNTPFLDPVADENVCDSLVLPTITGTNLSGSQAYYIASGGSGSSFAQGSAIHFSDFPSYPVTLYAYDGAAGCENEQTFELLILPAPSISSTTGGGDFCPDELLADVLIHLDGLPDWTISYEINGTSTTLTSSTSPINLGNAEGSYLITGIVDGNCTTALNETILVNRLIVDTSVTSSDPTLTANATGATYQWIDCGNGNSAIAGETNQSYNATNAGSYAVIVTENGCSDTSACYSLTNVGIGEMSNQANINVFPNPTKGPVNIQFKEGHDYFQIKLIDLQGAILQVWNLQNELNKTIRLDEVNGFYLIEIISKDGLQKTHRILVQK
jgi:hypothetical protein